jgi:hypothetical protein
MNEASQIKEQQSSILWITLAVCIVAGGVLVAGNTLTRKGQSGDVKAKPRDSSTIASSEGVTESTTAESPTTSGVDFELKDLSGKSVKLRITEAKLSW